MPTFIKLNSDFEIKLWTEKEINEIKSDLKYPSIICDTEIKPVMRADLLRLELLYLYGGIYLDVDMLPISSMNNLLAI